MPFSRTRSDHLHDQEAKAAYAEHQRNTFVEYLQPLIKKYNPDHPQSLYDAVTKYYLIVLLHQTKERADEIVRTGRPLIKMGNPGRYSVEKYKSSNKKKIERGYRLYYEALHKEHLEGGGRIKDRKSFIRQHERDHSQVVESAKLMAATKILYGKCLKNEKQLTKAKEGSHFHQEIKAYMRKIGCEKLPPKLKTEISNEIKQEAKTAKLTSRRKLAAWSRSLKKNQGASSKYKKGIPEYLTSERTKKYNTTQAQAQAKIPWERRTPAGKLMACQKAKARYDEQAALYKTPAGQKNKKEILQAQKQLWSLYKERKCTDIINNAKTAPAKTAPASLF